MKRFAIVFGIAASFLLGAALTVAAQDEHRDENNAKQEHQDQAKPAERQNEERPKQADEDRRNEDRRNEDKRNENRQAGERHDTTPQGEKHEEVQSGDRHDRPNGEHAEHRYARPQGEQRHIADNEFHAHFGREHHFRPGRVQVVEGRPQFYYSGYTFILADPWPVDWAYDSDDCYIDYMDGDYYLFNIRYPGVRILLYIL